MTPLLFTLAACSLFITDAELLQAVDLDGDGVRGPAYGGDDCDDSDPSIHPDAPDPPYDGVDSNCDGADDFDADGDGLVSAIYGGDDCDDDDPNVGDEPFQWYPDCDGDGVPSNVSVPSCAPPTHLLPAIDPCGGAPTEWTSEAPPIPDCDDANPSVLPGAHDPLYDGIDSDCDGRNDFDADGDGYLAALPGVRSDPHTLGLGDCDDTNASIHPNTPEIWYDGIDQDCDGRNDFDADGDGFVANPADAGGTAPFGGDCDDNDDTRHPGAVDIPYDDIDTNCDGRNDFDADGDGVVPQTYAAHAGSAATGDCDDHDPARSPLLPEVWYDGIDQDCDGGNDFDRDRDGVVRQGFDAQAGALPTGDCDDSDPHVAPGAIDPPYDGVDSNCDGADDYDADHDGYRTVGPTGLLDCDDTDASIHPGVPDVWYDGVDSDCDGANDYDQDADGSVSDVYGLVAGLPSGDCDDTDPARNSLLTERFYDGIDGDCQGGDDYDADGDGFPSAAFLNGTDCDDADPAIHPGATDLPYDGIDTNCDGQNDYDQDQDGYVDAGHPGTEGSTAPQGLDCDDADPNIHPGASDPPYDGVDSDCDRSDDYDADGDGVPPPLDCDDLDPLTSPLAPEIPYDGKDQDCDGSFDYDLDGDGVLPIGYDAYARPGDLLGDCDDLDATVHPNATEIWYDGVDQNCDRANDFDADGDAYVDIAHADAAGGSAPLVGDCDDNNAAVNPGELDLPYDGVDADCSGGSDADVDGDGFELLPDCTGLRCDCDDTDPQRWVADWEVSSNEPLQPLIDRACDGSTLQLAPGVFASPQPLTIDRALTLRGSGAALTTLSSAHGRILNLTGTGIAIDSVHLLGGTDVRGGCVEVLGSAAMSGFTTSGCAATADGGFAYVGGRLEIRDASLTQGVADRGGAVFVEPGASFLAQRTTFSTHNATTDGGTIYAEQAILRMEEITIEQSSASGYGGGVFALQSEVHLADVSLRQTNAREGGAIQLTGSAGRLAQVWIEDTETTGLPTSIGGDPLPSTLQLDYMSDAGPITELEDIDLVNNISFAGLSIYEPLGIVYAHDLVVHAPSSSYGINLEPQGTRASLVEAHNMLITGANTGIRVASYGQNAIATVTNATSLGTLTGLTVENFLSDVTVINAVLQGTSPTGYGAFWHDYHPEHGGSTLTHSWVVDSPWKLPSGSLPSGTQPPFSLQCADTAVIPFTSDHHLVSGSPLIGSGDPLLCGPTSPNSCLNPGYWGGPLGPSL